MQEKRLKHVKKLINKLKHPLQTNMWFFSDEKNFCQNQINSQNNRWLSASPKDVPKVMQTKVPATIMFFDVVGSEGDVMPHYFFSECPRLDTDGYIRVLRELVKPCIDQVAAGRPQCGSGILCHVTPAGEHRRGCLRTSSTTPD